jgi:hypothetical protein
MTTEEAGRDAGRAASALPWPTRLVARIWATVELERAAADLGLELERVSDDQLLGASVALARPPDEPWIALLEPRTEGRLAAWLARNGEGPAGSYLAVGAGLDAIRRQPHGRVLSEVAGGPFGRSVLLLGGPAGGPQLVLVESGAGTIDR